MALITSKLAAGASEVKIKITYRGSAPVLAGYEYQLRAADSNPPVEVRQGDNRNDQDDVYPLPTPIDINRGRRAIVTSNIAAIEKNAEYEVRIQVIQDGKVTDTLTSTGKVSASGGAALSYDMIIFE